MASISFFGLVCFVLQIVFLFWHGLQHLKRGEKKIGYIKLGYFFLFLLLCIYFNYSVLLETNINILYWIVQWGLAPIHLLLMSSVALDSIEKIYSINLSTTVQTGVIILFSIAFLIPLYIFDTKKKLLKQA